MIRVRGRGTSIESSKVANFALSVSCVTTAGSGVLLGNR